ncbi:MAG: hypothetical protein KBT32_05490 [Bacteroidales bacterium]|nr:hypothetical protein [Candidatus Physcocola equi]
MNTKKLKELVLDLAIHGKLVPQDPKIANQTTSRESLARNAEEQRRRIKWESYTS